MDDGAPGRHVRAGKKGGEAVGLTRRGKGTKLMAVVDGRGVPLGLLVASAQDAEVRLAEPTLATVRVPLSRGRPKTRPTSVVADKGYDEVPRRRRGADPRGAAHRDA